jgi:hypothetical protein
MVNKKLGLWIHQNVWIPKLYKYRSLYNKKDRPTPEVLCLMSEGVGGDPVRKGDDAVGEVMHGQPGDDLSQLHAGSSCTPAHHTHASIKETRAPIGSRHNYLVHILLATIWRLSSRLAFF